MSAATALLTKTDKCLHLSVFCLVIMKLSEGLQIHF